jgi:hypothetical protein
MAAHLMDISDLLEIAISGALITKINDQLLLKLFRLQGFFILLPLIARIC